MKQLKKPLLLSKEKATNDESSAYSWSYWRNLAYKVWMAMWDIGTTELVNNTGYVIKFMIIKVNGKPQIGFHPVDFVEYEKFVFNLNPEGKLIIHLTARIYDKDVVKAEEIVTCDEVIA
nr:hypothetical protein CFP56_15350 [Quercus suber]